MDSKRFVLGQELSGQDFWFDKANAKIRIRRDGFMDGVLAPLPLPWYLRIWKLWPLLLLIPLWMMWSLIGGVSQSIDDLSGADDSAQIEANAVLAKQNASDLAIYATAIENYSNKFRDRVAVVDEDLKSLLENVIELQEDSKNHGGTELLEAEVERIRKKLQDVHQEFWGHRHLPNANQKQFMPEHVP